MGASISELAEQIIPGFRNRRAKEKLVKLIRVSEYLMTDAEFQGAINDVEKLYGSRWYSPMLESGFSFGGQIGLDFMFHVLPLGNGRWWRLVSMLST